MKLTFRRKNPKCTIKEKHHGHMYELKNKTSVFVRICVSASCAASADYMAEKICLRMKLSRKYHVCWICFKSLNQSNIMGSGPNKFYECLKCANPIDSKIEKMWKSVDFSKVGYCLLWLRIKTLGNYDKYHGINRRMDKFAKECQRIEQEVQMLEISPDKSESHGWCLVHPKIWPGF